MNEYVLSAFVLGIDLLGGTALLASLLTKKLLRFPRWHRIWIAIMGLGLYGQSARNVVHLYTGVSPSDAELPLWVLKDIGISGLAITFMVLLFYKKIKHVWFR